METPLLTTKLYAPSARPNLVPRLRLIERLNAGLHRRLTLVSAPAGFGKTTCISEWVHALDCPVTWLSLDPADDDPGRFFAYLIAALQKVDANLGREIEGVLRSGQLPPGEAISTTLSNDIQGLEGRFLLVLDDFQVIQDRFILQVMQNLVASLPQPLHLVLLTREDPPLPLARLRANNQLTEIRAGDLRFTGPEADCFLNEVMALSLSQADIAVLEDKTEGWIVGLQLAGLESFGIVAEMCNDWVSDVGFTFDISLRGPLYDRHDRSNREGTDRRQQATGGSGDALGVGDVRVRRRTSFHRHRADTGASAG